MNFNRWLVTLLFLTATACVFGDEAADLRKNLSSAKGAERIGILQKLYDLSLETDDVNYQLKCINQLINEAHRQGNTDEEGNTTTRHGPSSLTPSTSPDRPTPA